MRAIRSHVLVAVAGIVVGLTASAFASAPAGLLRLPLIWLAVVAALAVAIWMALAQTEATRQRLAHVRLLVTRYEDGDFERRVHDEASDPLAEVTRLYDDLVHRLGDANQRLQDDQARLEAMLRGMVEGVLVVNEDARVVLANEAAATLLGLTASEAVGRRYVEVIRHPDVAAQIGRALGGQAPPGLELTLAQMDRTVVARASPVARGRLSGAVLVLHDITDLRRADRVRRDFVANVSHELRTPLTSIRGYVEALLDSTPETAESRRYLGVIFRQATRMERLVDDLLRLARLDARQEALDLAQIAVERLFQAVVADLAPTIESRGQTVSFDIAPDAATISGDDAKLYDVMRNLLENASNYSPPETAIVLGASGDDGWTSLTVSDRGPGIPSSDLARIFERFYRVDKARSRETGGTGLGLSIVRHLVELHGGQVSADNRPGGGAVFTVKLPVRRAAVS
ncbi:MAG: ATP-binding protein [Vicinamibacterales bacterium]